MMKNFVKDLRPRQRLHWKIISGNYDQIEVKDVGRFLWTYGVVIGILIARKAFKIIQNPISSVKNGTIPFYRPLRDFCCP